MSGSFPKFGVIEGGLSPTEPPVEPALLVTGGVVGGGGGPHDPGMEVRVAVLEQIAKETQSSVLALRGDVGGLDSRLRGVEVSIGRLEGKIDALTGTIVGQTSAALAKLPSWWQMPAIAGSTVALVLALIAVAKILQAHGLF